MTRHWSWWGLSWLAGILILGGVSPSRAEDLLPKRGAWEVGLRTGYSWGLSKEVGMVPINLRLGYIMFRGKWWIIPSGVLEASVEPFVSVITSVRSGGHGSIEMGAGLPVFTYYFDTGTGFTPYIEGGLGLLYTDLRGYHLGGHFSFQETFGLGASYFLSQNLALTAAWRYRHVSNAGLYDDNAGLNTGVFLAGFSYFLPQQ